LYELLVIDDQIKSLIHSEASELEIKGKVKQSESSLKQQAMQLVADGQTSLDEAVRITSL
jgi:general secretion pathway protein E